MEVRKPMAKKFTLDDIREAAEKKYGSFDIELGDGEVSLLNPLRLPKAKRDALIALQDQLDSAGEDDESKVDEEALLDDMIGLVAATPGQAKALLKALNGDLAMKVTIFNEYGQSTQAGEASASQD